MKRMLFNATQQEELRVAIVDGQKLIDIDIETAGREQRKGNIYNGVITRIEPSLEACFIDYGEDRHGFLPFKEVSRQYFIEGNINVRSARIQDALREGQELIVQVEKEERLNKGAALTTFISLAGRYLVLMPNNPRGGGVSRRVEGEERQELRETMTQLQIPEGMNIIARTAGIGRSVEELQWDLTYLLQLWRAIKVASKSGHPCEPMLIYLESSLVIRAIRDYFQPDIAEILIDTTEIYNQARAFMEIVMPDKVAKVKRYQDNVPLFSRFQIEQQIETAYSGSVSLLSGGSIAVDHTEALVAIDVNSARATKGADIEETATRTNLEAADEVARQLRLRDLGGLIVIDFIDMESTKSQREVEQRLKDALKYDRARVQMGKISRFGLMELSRQRLRPALSECSHITCPRCSGTGHIRDIESSALQVLRIIQEEAIKEKTAAIYCQVPVEVATFLLNEKRQEINKIESRFKVGIVLIPNKNLETPHYKLERLRQDDVRLGDPCVSWKIIEEATREIEHETRYSKRTIDIKKKREALIKGITPEHPAPSQILQDTIETVGVLASTPLTESPESISKIINWIKNIFGIRPVFQESLVLNQEQKKNVTNSTRKRAEDIDHCIDRNRSRNRHIVSQQQAIREHEPTVNERKYPKRQEHKSKDFEQKQVINMTVSNLSEKTEHHNRRKLVHQAAAQEGIKCGKLHIEPTEKNNFDDNKSNSISKTRIYGDEDRRRRTRRGGKNRERDEENNNRNTITKKSVEASISSIDKDSSISRKVDSYAEITNINLEEIKIAEKNEYNKVLNMDIDRALISAQEACIEDDRIQIAIHNPKQDKQDKTLLTTEKLQMAMPAVTKDTSVSSSDINNTQSFYVKEVMPTSSSTITTEQTSIKQPSYSEPTSSSTAIPISVMLEQAGLILINTDPVKLRSIQDSEENAEKHIRVPRKRKKIAQQVVDEVQMQQIETTYR